MGFSLKNYISIASFYNLMQQLKFSELFIQDKRFNISNDDSEFFLNMTKILPREAN